MVCQLGKIIFVGAITAGDMSTKIENWYYNFKIGYDAYLSGASRLDNPFPHYTEEWEAWSEGFQQAAEDD